MTGTNCDLFTHKQSRSYLNHLVLTAIFTLFYKNEDFVRSCVIKTARYVIAFSIIILILTVI
jgi:hypothetical protein